MSDGFALTVVILAGFIILIAKLVSHGEYDQQITLKSGTYLVGEDIPHGKCDMIAKDGNGNFCVKNFKSQNWVIGSNIGITSGLQPTRFRNLVLNKGDVLEINGQRISLCGVPDPYAMINEDAPDTEVQLAQTMALTEAGTFTVLMAHRPELSDKYAAAGFDLVVSGHAHGGQVRIPGLLNGLYAPNQGLFPSYAGGEYRIGEMTLVVSRGLARESTRLPRVFNRPELVIIELK